jgi:hypothetical protein
MRLYSFLNYYLSPLQHGLQTAHCVSEMSVKPMTNAENEAYHEWAEKHKTIIICNGGNVATLEDLFTRLTDLSVQFNLPLVKFYEDEQSLNNALTSVALIVPEWVYNATFTKGTTGPDCWTWNHGHLNADVDMPNSINFPDGSAEFTLISIVKSHRLA